jgi:large subunit ribosomal protein L35
MPWLLRNASSAKRRALGLSETPLGRLNLKGSKMPKLKTKSGVKKRFKVTGTGKIKFTQAGKRHGMIKRTKKFIRQARGTAVLTDADTTIVKKWMPYGLS